MATLNELTYNLINIIRGGRIADDESISLKQIAFWIHYYRAMLIRQEYEKGRTINPDVIQDLGCVPVQLVDKAECCEIQTNCYILKTVDPMPKGIEFYTRNAIEWVGTIDKKKNFPMQSIYRSNWKQYDKYTSNMETAYLLNGYIYITSNTTLEYINVRGVFENPEEAGEFNDCLTGSPCFSWDSRYPIAAHHIPVINEMVLKKELLAGMHAPQDQDNDAANNLKSPQVPK